MKIDFHFHKWHINLTVTRWHKRKTKEARLDKFIKNTCGCDMPTPEILETKENNNEGKDGENDKRTC